MKFITILLTYNILMLSTGRQDLQVGLRAINDQSTELLHGEYFTGIFSTFLKKSLLRKMKNAFLDHNEKLKKMLENDG